MITYLRVLLQAHVIPLGGERERERESGYTTLSDSTYHHVWYTRPHPKVTALTPAVAVTTRFLTFICSNAVGIYMYLGGA